MLSAFRVSLHDTSLHLPVVSQHPAELGLIQRADGADGTEELVQDVPAAANFIDQRWHINRRGFLDGIAVDALPDEPLMGASPASVLVMRRESSLLDGQMTIWLLASKDMAPKDMQELLDKAACGE